MRVAAVVPAAGRGRRLKSKSPKPFLKICGKPLCIYTLQRLNRFFRFAEIVLVVERSKKAAAKALLRKYNFPNIRLVQGGATRAASVQNAVNALSASSEWVLIHDVARPLVSRAQVLGVLAEARKNGAAICAVPATATVKRVDLKSGFIENTEDRRSLYLAQTPQVFRKKLLLARYKKLGRRALGCTDEAALFDGTRTRVKVLQGEASNIKITTPEDLRILSALA